MYRTLLLGIILLILLFSNCSNNKTADDRHLQYLFLGHTYDWQQENRLDPRLELLDYSSYDGIWLGGDICSKSSKNISTLHYLDSIFDLSSPNTHWAIGNHDIMDGDERKITAISQRPSYYSFIKNQLCILVLNTNLFWHNEWNPAIKNCEEKEAQMAFIQHFCDTLTAARRLIVLHHHGIFNEKKTNRQGLLLAPDNINAIPIRTDCDKKSDLTADWYPHLARVQARGIPVVCIAGDVGMNSKKYHFQTAEGIQLLGSGINNSLNMKTPAPYVKNFNPDTVLIASYWPAKDSLSWSFIRLNDLIFKQQPKLMKKDLSKRLNTLLEKY